jgi:hypothetical protein
MDKFVRALRIRSTTSAGGEVKSSAQCRKIFGMLKIPAQYDRDTTSAKFNDISRQVSPCFATRRVCCLLLESCGKSEMIRTQVGKHNRSVMVAMHGTSWARQPRKK